MATQSQNITAWPSNYFNYFTEIEEHFRKVRGTSLFLLSPLDWSLIETWKIAGIPLEAVLRGIDTAFAKWRERKTKIQSINSLAYCSQAVLAEAQIVAGIAQTMPPQKSAPAPFSIEEVRAYFAANAAILRERSGYEEIAQGIERLAEELEKHYEHLEDLERRLSALDDKLIGIARSRQSGDQLLQARCDLENQLRPYRSKMSAAQLTMLEKQFLDRNLLETAGLPRLSLFYLR